MAFGATLQKQTTRQNCVDDILAEFEQRCLLKPTDPAYESPEDVAAFKAALQNPSISTYAIWRSLQQSGIVANKSTIHSHRQVKGWI